MKAEMNFKQKFIKAIGSIPIEYAEMVSEPKYKSIVSYIENAGKDTQLLINILNQGIDLIRSDSERATQYFLIVSEIPSLNKEVRSFCLDTMLFAENDMHGTLKTFEDVTAAANKIAASLIKT